MTPPKVLARPKTIQAVLIPVNSEPEIIQLSETTDQLSRLVGHTLEGVTIRVCGKTLYAYIDGKTRHLPRNRYATALYNEQSDWINGAMIVTGPVGKLGQTTDVPEECIDAILRGYR